MFWEQKEFWGAIGFVLLLFWIATVKTGKKE